MIHQCHSVRAALSLWHWTPLSISKFPRGVHLFVTVSVHPKADTDSAAIIGMIQKAQSADALSTVIDDFNHLNVQKVLEQLVSACLSPCEPSQESPEISYGSVKGREVAGVTVGSLHLEELGVWTNDCSLTFQGCFSHTNWTLFQEPTVSMTDTMSFSIFAKTMTVCSTNRRMHFFQGKLENRTV